MVRHLVLFAFKEEADSDKVESLNRHFRTLPSLIPEIRKFESGSDISVENKHHGFTRGYVLTFDGTEERDRYLVHPDHRAFSDQAGPLLKDVLVFDYEPDRV